MSLNFLTLYPVKTPQLGLGSSIFVPIFSGQCSSRFFPENGAVIFKRNISVHGITAKSRIGFWCWWPTPAYLPCRGIEQPNSCRKLDKGLQRRCRPLSPGRPEDHDTGLGKRSILYELVGFVFDHHNSSDEKWLQKQKGEERAISCRWFLDKPPHHFDFSVLLMAWYFLAPFHFIGIKLN